MGGTQQHRTGRQQSRMKLKPVYLVIARGSSIYRSVDRRLCYCCTTLTFHVPVDKSKLETNANENLTWDWALNLPAFGLVKAGMNI